MKPRRVGVDAPAFVMVPLKVAVDVDTLVGA
jgi:hypothetical protein